MGPERWLAKTKLQNFEAGDEPTGDIVGYSVNALRSL